MTESSPLTAKQTAALAARPAPSDVVSTPPGALDPTAALVLLSGGQDSTTCLYWALERFDEVAAVCFDYGQRHAVEITQARKIADIAGVLLTVVPMHGAVGGSTLTDEAGTTDRPHTRRPDLPSSFTPGRNAVFFSIAAGLAFQRGLGTLVSGVCQSDDAGYPDCRASFVGLIEEALSEALGERLRIEAPLMHMTKAETWRLARELGCLDVVIEHSHTDYHGDRSERHPWGYGRLDNPASRLRAASYEEAKNRGWL